MAFNSQCKPVGQCDFTPWPAAAGRAKSASGRGLTRLTGYRGPGENLRALGRVVRGLLLLGHPAGDNAIQKGSWCGARPRQRAPRVRRRRTFLLLAMMLRAAPAQGLTNAPAGSGAVHPPRAAARR